MPVAVQDAVGLQKISQEKRTEGKQMAGKIITGVRLSLTLLTCVALGVQGSCGVQGACGSEEHKMTGQIQSMEMNETNRENSSNSDNDEYAAEDAAAENAVTEEETVETAAVENEAAEEVSTLAQIEDFPIVNQMPELPTGCEITALTMALNYYGYPVDKTVMASEYLPTASADRYYGSDGRLYGTDMNEYFIGDPFTENGIICGTGAIVTAADSYLADQGSSIRAVDVTGSSPEELYERVSQGQPVVVWVTISMADRRSTQGWYTEDGEYVDWSTNDHGAVLIGYTETTVRIADPISGRVEYDREQFEDVFESRGNQCVVLE